MGLTIREVGNLLGKDELNAFQSSPQIDDPELAALWQDAKSLFEDFNEAVDDLWGYIYEND